MKNSNNQNSKSVSKLINKKNAVLLSASSAVALVPIATTAAVTINEGNLYNTGPYMFNGREFSSLGNLMDSVKKNSQKINIEGTNSKWSIVVNGQTKYFDSPEAMRNEILKNQNIKEISIKTDADLTKYADSKTGALINQDFWKHVNLNTTGGEKTVYQGYNDVAYDTTDAAYESYFQPGSGYYFNGVFFSNKEQLRTYLNSVYFANRTESYNTVILKSPNGNSYPIDLSRTDAFETINNFIKANAQTQLEYSLNGKTNIINSNNIKEMAKNVDAKDLNYMHVQSNEGESRYVIDNADSSNLIGPYFYEGVLDVGSFTNKNMWRKVTGVSKLHYVESKADLTIGTFFTSILNDDNSLNKIQSETGDTTPLLFRTVMTAPDGKSSYDQWFLDELGRLSPQLKEAVLIANNSMMSGKKYNTFYKIPVLYSFLMQRAISWNLSSAVVDLIVSYFTNVCNYIQDILEFGVLYNFDALKSKDGLKTFNMKEFFQIGNPEYDLNTSTEYFLNQLKVEFPNIFLFAANYVAAENNLLLASGMIPHSSQDQSFLVEAGVFKDKAELDKQNLLFENTYNLFSASTYDEMLDIFIKNNADPTIKSIASTDPTTWKEAIKKINSKNTYIPLDVLLSGIGSKNNQYIQTANSVLKLEIRTYFETKALLPDGYLMKLYDRNPNLDKLATFLNFVAPHLDNTNFNVYRVYLAFLLEKKYNSNYFTPDIVSNSGTFAQRLTRLIAMVFGTGLLVGGSLNKVYGGSDKLNTPMDAPILKYYKTTNENLIKRPDFVIDIDAELTRSSNVKMTNTNQSGPQSRFIGIVPPPYKPPQVPNKNRAPSQAHTSFDVNAAIKGGAKGIVPAGLNINWFNPNVRDSLNPTSKYKVILWDCIDWISESSDLQDFDTLDEIRAYNERGVRRWGGKSNVSAINNPIDEASFSLSNNFNYLNEFGEQIEEIFQDTNGPDGNIGTGGGDGGTGNRPGTGTDGDGTGNRPGGDGSTGTGGNRPGGSGSGSGSGSGGSGGNGNDGTGNNPNTGNGSVHGDPNRPNMVFPEYDLPPVDYPEYDLPPVEYPDYNSPELDHANNQGSGANGWRPGSPEYDAVYTPSGSQRPSTPSIDYSFDDTIDSRPMTPDDFNKHKKSWFSGSKTKFNTMFNAIKDAATTMLNYAVEIFGGVFAVMEIAFFIFDILKEEHIQEFYQYVTADGTSFYWDGGLTVTKYFGLQVNTVHDISEMQLIRPVQITLPQIDEYYYFNGSKYNSIEDTKEAALKSYVNGGSLPMSGKFSRYYSLMNEVDAYKSKTIDELTTHVIESLNITKKEDGSFDFTNLNKSSPYIESASKSFSTGHFISKTDNNQTQIDAIVSNIRKTFLVVLPDRNNGIANGKISKPFDPSKNPELFPGDYWNGNMVVKNNPTNYANVLFDNSANLLSNSTFDNKIIDQNDFVVKDYQTAEQQSQKELFTKFKSAFSVANKNILQTSQITNKYSDISSNITTMKIYEVTAENGKKVYYYNLSAATSYLENKFKASKHRDVLETKIFYNGKYFNNQNELLNYVKDNAVRI